MLHLQLDNSARKSLEKEKNLQISYGSAASEAMFDFPCHFFQLPDCSGTIPYRLEYNCAVVFGEPLCPQDELQKLTENFHKHFEKAGYNIIYIIVSEKFAKNILNNHCSILMESCKELIFDPQLDPCKTSSRLRHRVEKAIKHGLTVHEYIPFNPEIEKALIEIGMQWQNAIKGPHIYLGHLDFFENYTGKRWFYIKDGNEITSMIMLSKLEAQNGWLLKFLITKPKAFHDTSEFLMTSVFEILRRENCRFVSKGMIPVNVLGEIKGLNRFTEWITRTAYKVVNRIYKFEKRKEYWLRYNPKIVSSYVLFARPCIGVNEIKALTKVFRSNSFIHHR
jgi:lysylphosphatidylglycerol synthetase-like protein (DUF2156 family)